MATATDHGLRDVKIFGSIARGEDTPYSDVDLVSRTSSGAAAAEARNEAVAL